jgi:uncharacterized protein (DUF697 family)
MTVLPLRPFLLAVREAREHAAGHAGLLVRGVMAQELARALAAGGDASVVRTAGELATDALVLVLAEAPAAAEIDLLRRAQRAGVAVAVVRLHGGDEDVPYVLATDVLDVPPGQGFPVEGIARVLARRLGSGIVPLGTALPALRDGASAQLIRDAALRNALIAGAPWGPAVAMPLLRRTQLGLVLDLSALHGGEVGPQRAPEAAGVAAASLGLRAVGRRVGRRLPAGRAAARVAIAYGGTLALGAMAALRARLAA